MFKVNNKDTRMKRRSGVFIVNFEHISHLVLVFLLLTLNMYFPAGYVQVYITEPCFLKLSKICNTLKSVFTVAVFVRFCRSYNFF